MLTFTFSSIFLAGWDGGGGASGSKLTRCPIPRRNALPPEFQPLLVLVSILKARCAQSSSGAPISSPRPLSPGDLAPPAPCSSSLCALSETDMRSLFIQSFPYNDFPIFSPQRSPQRTFISQGINKFGDKLRQNRSCSGKGLLDDSN